MTNIKFTNGSKLTTLQPNTTSTDVTITLPNKNGELVTLDDLNQAIKDYDNNNKNNTINMKNLQQSYTVLTQSVLRYTVGSNGDFETLTEALDYFCRIKVVYKNPRANIKFLNYETGHTVELTIKRGYKIEPTRYHSVDLSHVLITQEDADTAMNINNSIRGYKTLFYFFSCKAPILAKLNIEVRNGEYISTLAIYSTNSTGLLLGVTYKCVQTDIYQHGIECINNSCIIILGIEIDLKYILTKDTHSWYNPGRALTISVNSVVTLLTSGEQYINKKRFAVTVEYTNGKRDPGRMEWNVIHVNGIGAVLHCSERLEVYFNGIDGSPGGSLILIRHACSVYGYDSIIITAMNMKTLNIVSVLDNSRFWYAMCGDVKSITKFTLTNISGGWTLIHQNHNSLAFIDFNETTYNSKITASNANRVNWSIIPQNQFTSRGIFM